MKDYTVSIESISTTEPNKESTINSLYNGDTNISGIIK